MLNVRSSFFFFKFVTGFADDLVTRRQKRDAQMGGKLFHFHVGYLLIVMRRYCKSLALFSSSFSNKVN